MRPSTSRSVTTTIALAALLSLAACGGSDGGGDASPGDGTGSGAARSPAQDSEGARIEKALLGELEKHGYPLVHQVFVDEHRVRAVAYDDAGKLFDVTLTGPDRENRTTEPYTSVIDDGSQLHLALPVDQASFASDYDAAQEALAGCTESTRMEWQVAHNGDPIVRGVCGPNHDSPSAYVRWGDKTWTNPPANLLSSEGLTMADELLDHLDLDSISKVRLVSRDLEISTPDPSVAQPDGTTCPWTVSTNGWLTFCHGSDAKPFKASDLTATFSEVVPKIVADAEPHGGLLASGPLAGIEVGWPSTISLPTADVPVFSSHTAGEQAIVVYGLDGKKPDFISRQ